MQRHVAAILVALILGGCVNSSSVSFRNVDLETGARLPVETVDGLLALPEGKGPFPAVVLLHTCGGVSDHVALDWPALLTGNGYAALTVDTFGSRNAGRCPEARHLGGFTMWQDAYGALAYLAGRPDIDPDRIGVMGFSLGASAVEGLAAAIRNAPGGRNFRAGISLYGRCTVDDAPAFPLLEIIGDQDRNATNCTFGLADGVEVEILPGATHAFDNRRLTTMRVVSGDHAAIYSWEATQRAHEATLRFFARHLAR